MKYSFEEKIEAVKLHMESGTYRYPERCNTNAKKKTYAKQVRLWEAQYLLKGEEGIRHRKKNKTYSPEEKYGAIRPVILGETSLRRQSRIIGINSGQLHDWMKRYREKGMDGLKCSKRGRPGKNMEPIEQERPETANQTSGTDGKEKTQEELRAEIKELKQQNLLLQAEIEYRKKLQALVEEKARRKRMRRQRSYADSSKANGSEGK